MAYQNEYGAHSGVKEKQLVPQALRVYRHFNLDAHGLHPVSRGYAPYDVRFGPYRAECRKSSPEDVFSLDRAEHEAPHPDCTCGFYAHYNPAGDFYPGVTWWTQSTHLWAFVRAVCEVSGTVVMGSKGVRAEKMKILAVAVDWSKYRHRQQANPWLDVTSYLDPSPVYVRADDPDLSALELQTEIEDMAEAVAHRYGFRYFGSVTEMHAAYPQPDVSHLTPKPKPSPVGVDLTSAISGLKAQADLYAHAFKKMKSTFAQLTDAQVALGLVNGQELTAKERALAMKKDPSRKGPVTDGRGINYRR